MATHNTHNPLTGDGVNNTHNPLTGDKTGPYPPPGTNPVTGRTNDGGIGRHEQQYGPGGPTGPDGNQTHNTHNPFTGDGVNNTHNPLTGDKTGPHPPPGTNPITGKTKDGELGRHEQQYPAGANAHGATTGTTGITGTTGTTGTGTGYNNTNTIHDSTRDAHVGTGTGIGTNNTGTGPHPTSQQTSGGGAKALVGKVEATLGNILHKPDMHAKGVQKQEEAAAAKAAKADGVHHGTHTVGGTHADPTGVPTHGHRTTEENLAAEAGPAGAGAGAGQMLGGGGRSAI